MIVEPEWFGRGGQEELRPCADLVIGGRDAPRVVFELQRMLEIGELLIGEASSCGKRAGRALPTHSRILIGEAALECHEDLAAALNVIGDLLQQGVTRNIKCRDDDESVRREIGAIWEDKVS